MRTVQAVFENGVFRPTSKVDLPERSKVEFEPRPTEQRRRKAKAKEALYRVLSERFESGEKDVAARHSEHQP